MQEIKLEKVTLNIGVGEGGDRLQNAKMLLERISGMKAVLTMSRARNPSFKIRKGEPIGAKVTLRGEKAFDVVRRALDSRDHTLPESCADGDTVSFGVREYIDFPGIKYDPKLGMFGFDVCTTLYKAGKRVSRRKIRFTKLPKRQHVSPSEARAFFETNFKVKFLSKAEAESEQ